MVARKVPVSSLVFKELYPFGPVKPEDIRSWAQHVRDNLVPEARYETTQYYGQDRTYEVKLPGLDYTYFPHRRRLSRFPHHRQLFKALEKLGLTNWEIYELCNWDCTLWQKNRYLRDHPSLKYVRDTTGEDLPTWEEVHRQEVEHADGVLSDDVSEVEEEYAEPGEDEEDDSDKEDVEMEDVEEHHVSELAIERQGMIAQIFKIFLQSRV